MRLTPAVGAGARAGVGDQDFEVLQVMAGTAGGVAMAR
jgi:hypothetical protein